MYKRQEYIRGDERSFTIVAYPVPEIGERYEEIFDEIIRINTLDAGTYEKVQQTLIDALDQGEYVPVSYTHLLVVDLRNNPGGNLNTVCDMLDLMLPKGLIVYTEDKDGNRQEASSDDENQFTLPLACLLYTSRCV